MLASHDALFCHRRYVLDFYFQQRYELFFDCAMISHIYLQPNLFPHITNTFPFKKYTQPLQILQHNPLAELKLLLAYLKVLEEG